MERALPLVLMVAVAPVLMEGVGRVRATEAAPVWSVPPAKMMGGGGAEGVGGDVEHAAGEGGTAGVVVGAGEGQGAGGDVEGDGIGGAVVDGAAEGGAAAGEGESGG